MVIAKIFRNGRNQTVRIPVEMTLDGDAVSIEKQGDALILRPLPKGGWDRFFADESLVLPLEFGTGDDPPPQEHSGTGGPREALDVIKSLNAPAASSETMIQESVAGRYSDSH